MLPWFLYLIRLFSNSVAISYLFQDIHVVKYWSRKWRIVLSLLPFGVPPSAWRHRHISKSWVEQGLFLMSKIRQVTCYILRWLVKCESVSCIRQDRLTTAATTRRTSRPKGSSLCTAVSALMFTLSRSFPLTVEFHVPIYSQIHILDYHIQPRIRQALSRISCWQFLARLVFYIFYTRCYPSTLFRSPSHTTLTQNRKLKKNLEFVVLGISFWRA